MGFRVVRVGKALSWTPSLIKRYPLVCYVVILACYLLILKFFFEENPMWYQILFFVISGWTYTAIDNQLPRKRYRDITILFAIFVLAFSAYVFNQLVINHNTDVDTGAVVLGAVLLLLALGYGGYCAWCWRRQVIMCKDIKLQRELRAKRRRNITY